MRRMAAGAAGAAGLVAGYAFLVEPRWVQLTRPTIRFAGLHPGLEGLRIALLTDLHLGAGTPSSVLRRACRMAMAERPHLIAVTGDLAADSAPDFAPVLRMLAELEAPLGVYTVPGNHDHAVGIETWKRQVARHPVLRDLTNHAVTVRFRGARLCVAGVDDLGEGCPELDLPEPAARDFTVLLSHNPDLAERAGGAYAALDLVLSGHTHGGQIRLPLVGPLKKPSGDRGIHDQGLERASRALVYTSRGVGTVHLPARLFCRPEVALIRISSGEEAETARSREQSLRMV